MKINNISNNGSKMASKRGGVAMACSVMSKAGCGGNNNGQRGEMAQLIRKAKWRKRRKWRKRSGVGVKIVIKAARSV
jgi:hypothetical protein